MEIHKYEKLGPVLAVNFSEDETEIICYNDPREYFGRSLKKGDELVLMRIVLSGNYEGLIFKNAQIYHEHGYITVGFVKHVAIVRKEKSITLHADNPFDRALIKMGAMDVLKRKIDS